MMSRIRMAVLGCAAWMAATAGFAADVSGTWTARISSPFGILDYTFELRSDGVRVEVENAGDRAGDEVVQLYVRRLDSAVARPAPELKAFARLSLPPGERGTVDLTLEPRELAYWDESRRAFVLEEDRIELLVGRSSADIRLKQTLAVSKGGAVDTELARP